MLALLTPALLFIAFLLLLLVSLSVPIIKTIFLFTLTANVDTDLFETGATGSARFGVWGYCLSAIEVSVIGFDHTTDARCSPTRLGYTFDRTVARALGVEDFTNLITRTTTAALVLHPIACGLTFLTFIISLFMLRRGSNGTSRVPSFVTLGVGILASLLTTVVFLVDVIFVAIVRNRVNDQTDGDLTLDWGNAVWMALGATVALWLAMVGALAGICACGTRYRNRRINRY